MAKFAKKAAKKGRIRLKGVYRIIFLFSCNRKLQAGFRITRFLSNAKVTFGLRHAYLSWFCLEMLSTCLSLKSVHGRHDPVIREHRLY